MQTRPVLCLLVIRQTNLLIVQATILLKNAQLANELNRITQRLTCKTSE